MATKIDYLDETWNPVAGCTKCSPGCDNCYAERMAHRLKMMGNDNPQYLGKTDANGNWTGEVECCDWLLDKPLHWRSPRTIGVCFMSDLFHPKVPFEFVWKVMLIANKAKQHRFLFLTKRPKIMADFFSKLLSQNTPPNIHLGISVCNQAEADEKIPILLQIPAAHRWLSIEPLLGEIDLGIQCIDCEQYIEGPLADCSNCRRSNLDWVVVGGESGPKRRECKLEWVRDIVQQCKAAGVPCFVKQIPINGKVSHNPDEWPEDLRVREPIR